MAMTKTVELQQIEVTPNSPMEPGNPGFCNRVTVRDLVTVDDPDDDTLPIQQNRFFSFVEGDDVSDQPQLVQDICAAVWA